MRIEGKANKKLCTFKNLKIEIIKRQNYAQNETKKKKKISVGIGVIICDHEGSVIAALSQHLRLPLGPLEAKTKAMDVAASFAWDMGI